MKKKEGRYAFNAYLPHSFIAIFTRDDVYFLRARGGRFFCLRG